MRLTPIPLPVAAQDDTPPLRLDVLARGWLRIALVTLAAVVAGGAWTYFLATPIYRTHVTLMLEPQEQRVIDLGLVLPGLGRDEQVLNTQVEVLRSRDLVGRLVDRLDLVADPEFNATLRPASPLSLRTAVAGAMTLAGFDPPPRPPAPSDRAMHDATVTALIRRLEIQSANNSLILTVAIGTSDADKSAAIVNALAAMYVQDQITEKLHATVQATSWLTARVVELKAAFEQADARARSAQAGTGLHSTSEVEDLERRIEAQRRRLTDTADPQARAALEPEIAALAGEIRQANADLVRIDQLRRDADTTGLLYENFLARLKETSVQGGAHKADARVLSAAVVPLNAAFPKPLVILALCLLGGGGLGALWVLAREEWALKLRSAEEAERVTGLPVLAVIPETAARDHAALAELAVRGDSALSAAVQGLRTAVQLSNLDHPPQVLMVTSSVAGEGKSALALMLAQAFAGWGKSVLLIEADIRDASLRATMRAPGHRGLLSVVAALADFDDVVHRPAGLPVDMLFAEASVVQAADILGTSKFAAFLSRMRERYDYIVIDTPPVLGAPDAPLVAARADAVIYLARWNHTPRRDLRRGLAVLARSGAAITGLALSRANPRKLKLYGPAKG